MFGLGLPELIVICVIALLVFGPNKLPDAGKAIGQAIRGFKSSMEGNNDERTDSRALASGACAGCGRAVEPQAAFCPACGRPLKQGPA
jgi:sec-independent protein translocase protein TatA